MGMEKTTIWTCDNCGNGASRDDFPKGWQEVTLRYRWSLRFGAHNVSMLLCGGCIGDKVGMPMHRRVLSLLLGRKP